MSRVIEPSFKRRLIQVAVASCFATAVQANPTGPSVVSGAATFNAVGNNLTVTNSPGAIINWQGFSIRPDEVTRFIQSGAASAVLNRVTGAEHSQLLGQLLSNGRVFLINPNGVTIGAGARIDTAGFVASSLNLSNEDFLAGKFRFTDPGNAGKVTNAGTINAHSGGPVYLVAPTVENHGVVTAPNGDVMLAAGRSVELVSAASPHLRVQVQAGGEALNVGRLVAESGRVGIYGAAVRNSGLVSADSAQVTATGTIVLKASRDVTLDPTSTVTANGPQGGLITVQAETGTLLADGKIEAKGSSVTGGDVRLLGTQVGLVGNAAVDASGRTGGGQLLVGGDYQGKNPDVQNASASYVGADVTLRADAGDSGDGGKIVVWADGATRFQGAASARGGATAGDGGFVEVSGKDWLAFTGRVDTSAPAGAAGMLLLDPTDITISAAATSSGTCPPAGPCFTLTGNPATANLSVTDLQNALANTNVTVNTASTAASAGDITVANAVTYGGAAARTLTLTANRDVNVNANINATNNNGPLTVNVNAARNYSQAAGATITTRRGDITINAGGTATLGGVNTNTGSLAAVTAGALTVNSAGAITQAGASALDVRAQATFGAGVANNITLTGATNNFRANVQVTSGNNVSIRDNSALAFGGGASAISGALVADSNGTITQAAGSTLTVNGNATFNTRVANADVTLAEANSVAGTVTMAPVAGSIRDVNWRNTSASAQTPVTPATHRNLTITHNNAAITLPAKTLTGTLNLTAGGAITDTGALAVTGTTTLTAGAANDITLDNANDFGGQVRVVSARDVTLNDVNALAFGAGGNSTVSRNLSVTAGGAVTQANGLLVTGTTSINAGANNVTLTNAANNFGGALSVTGNNVSLVDVNALVLGTVNAAGTLAVTTNGALTDTGNVTVAGTTTLTAGAANDITLDNANDFGGPVRIVSGRNVVLNDVNGLAFGAGGASVVSGTLNVTAAGAITQANPLTVTGATTLAAGAANNITLTDAANSFGNVRVTSGNNVAIRDNTAFAFGGGASTVSGALTVDSNGNVTQAAGSTLTVGGGMTVNTRGATRDVVLNLANDVTGAVSVAPLAGGTIQDINYRNVNAAAQVPATPASFRNYTLAFDNAPVALPATTLTGNLNVTAGGAITDTGSLAITGTTTLAAGTANITLDNANNFGGNVRIVSSNNVTLNDTGALAFGGGVSTVSGNLALTTAGAVTQASGLTVTGTTSINAGIANDVTLANAANDFGGAVSVAANDISLRDANALVLGTVTATTNGGDTGSLTLQAGGSVTQTGVVTTPALVATLAGGASALNLGTQPNAIASLGAVTAPGGVNLTNGNVALAVNGNVTTTNAPVAISTGTAGYSQANNIDVNAGTGSITITADTVAIGTNTGNNAFTTSGTLTVKPTTASQAMSFSGAAPFDLTAAEVTAFATGATGPIVVGDAAAATGTMTVGAPVNLAGKTLTLNAGAITDGGVAARTITAANLNLNARTGAIGAVGAPGAIDVAVTNLTVNTANQNGFVSAVGAVNLGPGGSNLGAGGLNLTATGAITQSGAITATGSSTLAAPANSIVLSGGANDFGTVTVTNAGNVTLNDANAITLGGATATGSYTATAGGAITQSGLMQISGSTTFNAGSTVTFANTNQTSGNLTVIAGGPITQTAGALQVGGSATFDTTANAGIGSVSITGNGNFTIGNSTAGGNLALTSTGNITLPAGNTLNVSGDATLNAAGAVALNGTTNIGGNLQATGSSGGTFTLAADTNLDSLALPASGPITVNLTRRSVAGALTAPAVTLTSAQIAGTTTFTTATAPTTVTTNTYNLTQAAPVARPGQTLTIADAGGTAGKRGNATLPLANDFAAVGFTGGDLQIRDANALTLNATSVNAGTTSTGTVLAIAGTDLTLGGNLSAAAGGTAATLAAGGNFLNPGSATIATPGRWLVYSTDPATNDFGALASGNQALWGRTYPAAVPEAGNRYVFSTQPTLTFTSTNVAKTYGQDATATVAGAYAVSGFVNAGLYGSVFTQDTAANAVSGTPAVTSLGSPATAPVAGSPYAINVNTAGVTSPTGYAVAASSTGQLTINPAALTVTADNQAKTYGQTITFNGTEFTSAGLQNGETIGAVTLVSPGAPATASVAGSPYAITPSAATGGTFNAANYTITYNNGVLTVAPAGLTVTANNQAKTYGQTFVFAGTEFTSVGLQNGETIGSVTLTSPGAVATAGVPGSPYAINASNATGGTFNPANYAITYNNGVLTVAPAALTVTANNQAKTYGQTFVFNGTEFTSAGLQNGETVGSVTLASAGAAPTATVPGSPYAIAASNATGGTFNPGNYTITYANGVMTVTPLPIVVTANNQAKVYGQPDPALTFTAPTVNGDVLSGTPVRAPGETVAGGPYAITQGTVTNANNPNYTITFVNGQLVITPAPLTIAADDKARAFGAPNPLFTATATGFQFGETVANLNGSLVFTTPATTSSPAGAYPITPGGVSSGNYTITFVDGVLVVAQGAPPADQALITAVGRSESDPTAGLRAARPIDCLTVERPGERRVLGRCF